MTDATRDDPRAFAGIGSSALVGGVASCLGIKVIGGVAVIGGLGTALGLSTGSTSFVVGGAVGAGLATLGLAYRRSGFGL